MVPIMSGFACLRSLLGAVLLAAFAVAQPALASTVSFPLTMCDISGGCTPGSYGTVTVTSIGTQGDEVSVTLSLNNSSDVFAFGGSGQPLMFELSTPGAFSVSGVSDPRAPSDTFVFNSSTTGMHDDGTGTWNYWISCTSGCGSGTSSAVPAALTFDVTGTLTNPITPQSFIRNGNSLYFGTDIGAPNGTGYNTGDVGAPSAVPLPPSLPLLAGALAVLLMISRRAPGARLPIRSALTA
jgi:hypothetical protein